MVGVLSMPPHGGERKVKAGMAGVHITGSNKVTHRSTGTTPSPLQHRQVKCKVDDRCAGEEDGRCARENTENNVKRVVHQ